MKPFVKNVNVVYEVGERVQFFFHHEDRSCDLHLQWGMVTEVLPPDKGSIAGPFWYRFVIDTEDDCGLLYQSCVLWSQKELDALKEYRNHVEGVFNHAVAEGQDGTIVDCLKRELHNLERRRVAEAVLSGENLAAPMAALAEAFQR